MYEEPLLFGPFTIKQTIALVSVGGISYLGLKILEPKFYILLMIISIIIAVKYVIENKPNKIEVHEIEKYLKRKEITIGRIEYSKWISQITAETSSQIKIKKAKGQRISEEEKEVLEKLSIALESNNKNGL